MSQVSDAILAGVAYIEKNGWCGRGASDDEGRVCMMYSVIAANGGLLQNRSTILDAHEALNEGVYRRTRYSHGADWNDRAAKGKQEVIEMMRTIAREVAEDEAV